MIGLARSVIVTISQYFYHVDETHIEASLSPLFDCIDVVGVLCGVYICLLYRFIQSGGFSLSLIDSFLCNEILCLPGSQNIRYECTDSC